MIKEKVFVVTGAGNGIGREVVLNLVNKGARVAAIDLDQEGLNETKKLSNVDDFYLRGYRVDITKLASLEKSKEIIVREFEKIDGLIHVAGIIQPFVKVNDLDYKDIKRVMDINFYGTVYVNKVFLDSLFKEDDSYLVNVSSMGGFLPVPGQTVYGASKAAVKLLTEGLYAELKDTNVSVTLVFPGAIKTDISKNSGVEMEDDSTNEKPSHKMLEASKAADMIVKGMLKKKLYVYVGNDSKMMNKIYRLAPKKATDMIAKRMEDLLE